MSELRSLYIRVKVKKENLESFFNATPAPVQLNKQWLSWWDHCEMYSKSELSQIPIYARIKNRTIIDELISNKQNVSTEEYNTSTNTWRFVTVFFSENYYEILPMLSWLQNLSTYLKEDDHGDAIIYDFFWGDNDVMVHTTFTKNKFELLNTKSISEINDSLLDDANRIMEAAIKKAEDNFND